jgi:hypothetical protein
MAEPSDDLTPEWFTEVLTGSGALASGRVTAVSCTGTDAFNSRTVHASLTYSADAAPVLPGRLPGRLVVKRNAQTDWSTRAGAVEVRFYQEALARADHPGLIVRCFAAEVDPATQQSHLLLEDLTETHKTPVGRAEQISIVSGVPAEHEITGCVETLADLHAYWWEHPYSRSGPFRIGYGSVDEEDFAELSDSFGRAWKDMRTANADWLPAEVIDFYDVIDDGLEIFWRRHRRDRFRTRSQLTLTHGDSYFANFLCPREPGGPVYLIDWQSPEIEFGAVDLVNLCATFWNREQRHEGGREIEALRRYHDRLTERGVTGYTFGDLMADYRVAISVWLLIPVFDAADGSARSYWWPKMQCLLEAADDHDCLRLFGE